MINVEIPRTRNNQLEMFSEAEPQPQHSSEPIAIRNLFNDRAIYDNYPPFQRGFVWPEKYKRALIDSILRGFPIHPLLAYKAVDEEGNEQYWIIDGHQRLTTIYEFMQGKFATSTVAQARHDESNSLTPIEPGRRFNELSARAKNVFCAYKIMISSIEADRELMGLIFRRVQNQLLLTMAEKLASYRSKAMEYAIRLQDNIIWSDFYMGRNTRKESLQGSLGLLLVELSHGYAMLSSRDLHKFASGAKDDQINTDLYEKVESRIEILMHAFAETTFTHRSEVIPMYQATMLLEEDGYVFTSSDKGILTQWFGHVLHEKNQEGRYGFASPFTRMTESVTQQREFWDVHLPRIKDMCINRKSVD